MKKLYCLIILSGLLLAGCSSDEKENIEHVIVIGLDGWGAYSFEKADMPVVKRMAGEGSYTLELRSVLPSASACNWASMFMGAGPELHGYTTWGSKTPDLPPRTTDKYGFFPSIFSLLHDQREGSKIGLMYEWDGIGYLCPKEVLDADMNIPAVENSSAGLAEAAVNYILQERPTLLLVSFDEPDVVGHSHGHDTPEYYAKLEELDRYVGMIEQAVKDAGIYDNTVFIITADHGGINKGHGGKTMEEMQVPFIAFGKGIRQGYQIESSMMQYDTAATIAEIFGLERPQVWIGRPAREIFR